MINRQNFSKQISVAGLVLCAALLALAGPHRAAAAPQTEIGLPITVKQLALKQDMRKLWTEHVLWTREYILAKVDGQGDAVAEADRLMLNQEQIGTAISQYYGAEAGARVTLLLKEHISIAVAIVDAAIADDTAEFNKQNALWADNGAAFAHYLAGANPNWPEAALNKMMTEHLATTAAELQARLAGDYEADVAAFDVVYNHVLMMSDALSDGIIKQFPAKF